MPLQKLRVAPTEEKTLAREYFGSVLVTTRKAEPRVIVTCNREIKPWFYLPGSSFTEKGNQDAGPEGPRPEDKAASV